jgi:hypothetical protein
MSAFLAADSIALLIVFEMLKLSALRASPVDVKN